MIGITSIIEKYKKFDLKEVRNCDLLTEEEKKILIDCLNQASLEDYGDASILAKSYMGWKKHKKIMEIIKDKKSSFVSEDFILKINENLKGDKK